MLIWGAGGPGHLLGRVRQTELEVCTGLDLPGGQVSAGPTGARAGGRGIPRFANSVAVCVCVGECVVLPPPVAGRSASE